VSLHLFFNFSSFIEHAFLMVLVNLSFYFHLCLSLCLLPNPNFTTSFHFASYGMYLSPAALLASQENWVYIYIYIFFHESSKQKRVYKDIKPLGAHSSSSAFLWLLKEPLLSPHAKASCSLHGEFNEIRYIHPTRN
jgi:hypothetical protein